ncbi:MAG: hypothetical protein LBM04_00090, partial [Opitutaceae bacterium]|nr:hypothetical protein [Opitutaceae bacterium]
MRSSIHINAKIPAHALVLACLCAAAQPAVAAGPETTTAPGKHSAPAKNKSSKDEIVEMSIFTVTARTRAVIPLDGIFLYRRFGHHITTPIFIYQTKYSVFNATMKEHGLSGEDRIISINGQKIEGMSFTHLRKLWNEGEPGQKVVLLV